MSESKLLPVVKAEAELASVAVKRMLKGSADDEAKLAALAGKRTRILENYDDGLYDKPTRDARLAGLADQESKLSAVRWIRRVTLPPDIETAEPSRVNSYLRRLFTKATVDMSQKALRGPSKWVPSIDFEWRDRSMRYEGEDVA